MMGYCTSVPSERRNALDGMEAWTCLRSEERMSERLLDTMCHSKNSSERVIMQHHAPMRAHTIMPLSTS